MKKLLIFALLLVSTITYAQVPYFGSTTGKGKWYTYTQIKVYPGENKQSFYTSFNAGVTNNFDVAFNYNSADNSNAWGVKYSFYQSNPVSVAIQPMVAFDMSDNYKFANVTTGLYVNGYITKKLSYISNTWYTQTKDHSYWEQWSYLGYDVAKFTFVAGAVTDISDKCKTDLVVGAWYPIKKSCYVYLWGGNLTNHLSKPKVTIGFDYKF